MTIAITAKYFAVFRERAGCESERISTEVATAAELFRVLSAQHGFADAQDRCKVAVNGTLAAWDTQLDDGDEVLFFPPVAGG